jgi:TatA/E family protein of Tat protein translocase
MFLLLIFGNRLPTLGKSLGEAMKNFKKGLNDEDENEKSSASSKNTQTKQDLLNEIERIKMLLQSKEDDYLFLKERDQQSKPAEPIKQQDYIDV